MQCNPKLFEASGYNDRFYGQGLSFSAYIRQTQSMLKSARLDLSKEYANTILSANSPYEWRPINSIPGKKIKRGILLIHGLYDSPFIMMDLGRFFVEQGFLVRSILLPGHGTVPGDLLNVQHTEWIRAVNYATEDLRANVEEVFLAGFSLGGALATHYAARNPTLSGLILLAPALGITHGWLLPLVRSALLFGWLNPSMRWLCKRPQNDYTKYQSFTINSAYQTYKLVAETQRLLKKQVALSLPIFAAVSMEDEVINPDALIHFFNKTHNPRNRLWIYGAAPASYAHTRVEHHSSHFPDQKVLNFSHLALPVAPENSHYGAAGDFKDFLHYPNGIAPSGEIFLGARPKKNLQGRVIQRLSYNPDFPSLLQGIREFLH